MLNALNELCIEATKGNNGTTKALNHFLDYAASNQEPMIIYRESDMILTIDSDAAYLVAPKARSRAAGYFYLRNKYEKLFDGAVYVIAKVIERVMGSAAEAECGGLDMNEQESIPLRMTL